MNFTARPLHSTAFDTHPFAFLNDAQRNDIANVASIDLIENGDRNARDNWQKKQLTNLLRHAHSESVRIVELILKEIIDCIARGAQ